MTRTAICVGLLVATLTLASNHSIAQISHVSSDALQLGVAGNASETKKAGLEGGATFSCSWSSRFELGLRIAPNGLGHFGAFAVLYPLDKPLWGRVRPFVAARGQNWERGVQTAYEWGASLGVSVPLAESQRGEVVAVSAESSWNRGEYEVRYPAEETYPSDFRDEYKGALHEVQAHVLLKPSWGGVLLSVGAQFGSWREPARAKASLAFIWDL